MSDKPAGTVAQAAAVLGVSPQRIHQMLAEGKLELSHKIPGLRGAKYVTVASVEALKQERGSK